MNDACMTPALFRDYERRGFALCRVPIGKKPTDPRWQLTPRTSPDDFTAEHNVGLLCGPLSRGLVGVDLDFLSEDADAWGAADELLPETGLIDGRPGKPKAHRFYRITDVEWPDSVLPREQSATRGAMDAGALPRFAGTRHWSNGNLRGIDLIGAGAQLVIPPSLHESGKRRQWWGGEPGEATPITYAELLAAVEAVAARLGLRGRKSDADSAQRLPPDAEALDAVPVDHRERRLAAYLAKVDPLRHGAGQGYHQQQYRIACKCCEFGVPIDRARPLYARWCARSATPDGAAVNDATLDRAYRTAVFGSEWPAAADDFKDASAQPPPKASVAQAQTPRPRLAVRRFTDTKERKPDWIWRGYLLRRATHVLGGKQGNGKGLFTADIIARISRGAPMPDGTGGGRPGRVLICTREDDPEMSLYPRLRVAGADMSMVDWSYGDFEDGDVKSMRDTASVLIDAVTERGIDFLSIDPLGAWVEDDANNGAQIRAVIDPMNRLARETGCCVLFNAHLRKTEAEDPMDSFLGSGQVTAAVRVAMMISKVDGAPTERHLAVVKTNFRSPDYAMRFRFASASTDPDDPPALEWHQATPDDTAAQAASRRRGAAPIVAVDVVMPYLADTHQRFREMARAIRKKLLPTIAKVTVAGVEDALNEAIASGIAFEGRDESGARTVGTAPRMAKETELDRATAAWVADPGATVREIAERAGCSKTTAHRARGMALSRRSVPRSKTERWDNGTMGQDNGERSVPSPLARPIEDAQGRGTGHESDATEKETTSAPASVGVGQAAPAPAARRSSLADLDDAYQRAEPAKPGRRAKRAAAPSHPGRSAPGRAERLAAAPSAREDVLADVDLDGDEQVRRP